MKIEKMSLDGKIPLRLTINFCKKRIKPIAKYYIKILPTTKEEKQNKQKMK